jgi:hypothetical protein
VMSGEAGDPCPSVEGVAPVAASYTLLAANRTEYVVGGYTGNLSLEDFEAILPSDLVAGDTSSVIAECLYPGNASFEYLSTPFTVTAP